jgi:hypothetical protein
MVLAAALSHAHFLSLTSTMAVADGIQTDSYHSNDDLKENENNNNPFQLFAV